MAKSVNEKLLDRTIQHAVFLERFKSGEARRAVGVLRRDVYPDLIDKVKRDYDRIKKLGRKPAAYKTKRYKDLVKGVTALINKGIEVERLKTTNKLDDLAQWETEFEQRLLQSRTPDALNVDYATPSPVLVREVVNKTPMEGKLLKDWYDDLKVNLRTQLVSQLNIGLTQGESIPAITRRFRKAMKTNDRSVTAIVRTATAHAVNGARQSVYEANTDVIKGVQWVSTLDTRTTLICASLDGKVYKVGTGPRPPIHYQCRSTTIPVLKSWKSLGFKAKELPASTRASMNGQVSDKTTYGEWLKRQSEKTQNKVLGKRRAALFRSGKVNIEQFVGADYAPIPLSKLKAEETIRPKVVVKPKPKPKIRELRDNAGNVVGTLGETGKINITSSVSTGSRITPIFDDKGNVVAKLNRKSGKLFDTKVPISPTTEDVTKSKSFTTVLKESGADTKAIFKEYVEGGGMYDIREGEELIRKGGSTSANKVKALKFNEALDKSSTYQGTVYRGGSTEGIESIKNLKRGDVWVQNNSISTSKTRSVADEFLVIADDMDEGTPYLLEMRSKTGVDISKYANEIFEQDEVLARMGSRYRVSDVINIPARGELPAHLKISMDEI